MVVFPLQGKITAVAGSKAKFNIGRQHGVKKGNLLEAVIENSKESALYTVLAELS